jgi:hypothetical protein
MNVFINIAVFLPPNTPVRLKSIQHGWLQTNVALISEDALYVEESGGRGVIELEGWIHALKQNMVTINPN